jgi:hypothetical protein
MDAAAGSGGSGGRTISTAADVLGLDDPPIAAGLDHVPYTLTATTPDQTLTHSHTVPSTAHTTPRCCPVHDV